MADCDWAILCDYAFLDAGGKMCIIGIFERIYAQTVPAIHPQAVIVAKLRGAPGEEVQLRVEIRRPNGLSLMRLDGTAKMSVEGGAGIQLRLAGLNLPDMGTYECSVYIENEKSYVLPFQVGSPPSAVS